MEYLHFLDTWLYQLIVSVWAMYWPILVTVLVFTAVERLYPLEPGQPWQLVRFNLVWQLLSLIALFVLSSTGWGAFIVWLSQLVPTPLVPLTPAESAWGEFGRILLIVVLGDLVSYWSHRLQHATPVLWAIHRLHHDEEHLHAATAIRQHWLNLPFTQIIVLPPLAWLLGAQTVPAMIGVLLGAINIFQHANIRLEIGWLTPVIAGPQWHRIHHARMPALYNRNFSAIFPVWDVLFGTHRQPLPGEFAATGLQGSSASDQFGRTFVQPLMDWWHLLVTKRGGDKRV
jgi:sterol desaturase/sphingolipid hydroxylase (fatty acid hydroxylase superfamily)